MLKEFSKYYVPHLRLFVLDMLTAVTTAAFTVLIPKIAYVILSNYLPKMDFANIILNLTYIGGIVVILAAADFFNVKWGNILGVRMEADMRRDLFSHLQKLSFSYFDRTKTGHIMSRLSNDLTLIAETAHHSPEDLLISVLIIVGAFSFMFLQNWRFALFTFLPLPLIIIWGTFFMRRMKRGFRQVRKKVADLNSQVENSIQGIRVVKAFTNEEYQVEKFHEVNTQFKNARENVFGTLAGLHSGVIFMIQGYSALFVVVGVLLVYFNKATVAEVFTFFMYSRYIVMPTFRMLNFAEQFQQGFTAFERFHQVMLEEPDIQDRSNALSPPELKGNIELKNVYFKYQLEEGREYSDWILDNVSIKIPAGLTVALVGESGAGKSTIAALVPRFYEVAAGQVLIDGNDVMDLKQKSLRENVGIVQQNPFLFDASIRENILIGKADATDEEMVEAARNANIYDFIMSLPDGFESQVGEQGVKLSGGQKQRIAIARVFLKNPAILIFDEATSALDNESEALVQDSMDKLCRERTTLVIAHRLSTVRNADYIYCVKDGRISEEGRHEELLELNGYYHKLYSMHNF
ncbi:ABC transporter ATP-binding protein [Lentisphaerota bacterium ZTH]|nr:ABC transporter ATP-binding protein [Lentisphaerota bacterium]WET06041.1 ABC transporter ATP-binding protein [Lentisphaerota bacterium ZTH]